MFMFGITTFIFALGIIALALERTGNFRVAELRLNPSLSDTSFIRYNYAWAVITSLMVRLRDVLMPFA